MSDSDCIFCGIVAGRIPARVVRECDHALAFLDVGPLAEGHTLLIPKAHAARIDELSHAQAAALFGCLPDLARAVSAATGAPGLNILQNNGAESGQVVMHVHIHLIPRRSDDGLGYRWNAGSYPPGRADAVADSIRAALPDR